MCFVCGLKNALGLKVSFFVLDNNELAAVFTPRDEHQGYPGRLHGGIAAAVLDEVIGRAVNLSNLGEVWGVTVDLSLKYRKPLPIGEPLRARGRITKDGGRFFEGTGEILLADGTSAVEASGRYIRLPLDKLAVSDLDTLEWAPVPLPDDPGEIDLPD
jgi:uncharacterized protein (TIGR00369 family)